MPLLSSHLRKSEGRNKYASIPKMAPRWHVNPDRERTPNNGRLHLKVTLSSQIYTLTKWRQRNQARTTILHNPPPPITSQICKNTQYSHAQNSLNPITRTMRGANFQMLPQTPCSTRIYIRTQVEHTNSSYLRLPLQPPNPEDGKPEPRVNPRPADLKPTRNTMHVDVTKTRKGGRASAPERGEDGVIWSHSTTSSWGNSAERRKKDEEQKMVGEEDADALREASPCPACERSTAPASCPPYYFPSPLTNLHAP